MIALVTGGSGCGKSTWAERLVRALPARPRVYIATMQVYDEESVRRVERHRRQRADAGYVTIERPMDMAGAEVPPGCAALLEDLPNWLAAEMFSGGDPARIVPDLKALSKKCADLVVVTNDVFSDGVTYAESTDQYLRALARINAAAAALADTVVEVVYSIPVALKGALPCV